MEITNETQKEAVTESLKLIKNTKGYGWEIRILSTDISRIEQLNNEMLLKFGSKE